MGYGPRNLHFSFTGKNLTHFGGFFLVQHFFQQLNLRQLLTWNVRFKQRNNRYSTSESILALLYPLLVGLGRIDATGILRRNGVFRYLTGLKSYPDPTTLRRFLLRFACAGLASFLKLHDALKRRMIGSPRRLILDLDSTVLTVYGRQEGAEVGYNPKKRGRRSYHPLLCFEGITRDIWDGSFHPGNVHSASVACALLKRVFLAIPSSVRDIRVRADNAFYDHEIIEFLKQRGTFYAIVAKLSRPVKARLGGLRFRQVSGDRSIIKKQAASL